VLDKGHPVAGDLDFRENMARDDDAHPPAQAADEIAQIADKGEDVSRFFTNAAMLTTHPDFAAYRPITVASLAIDYWLGRGLKPFWFHLSTFLVFLLQLVAMYAVFMAILNAARPAPEAINANRSVSLLAVPFPIAIASILKALTSDNIFLIDIAVSFWGGCG